MQEKGFLQRGFFSEEIRRNRGKDPCKQGERYCSFTNSMPTAEQVKNLVCSSR